MLEVASTCKSVGNSWWVSLSPRLLPAAVSRLSVSGCTGTVPRVRPRVPCVSRVCPGSPRCLFTGTPPVSFYRSKWITRAGAVDCMSIVDEAELAAVVRVLQAAAPPLRHKEVESEEVIALRAQLLPHVQALLRREKQRHRYTAKATTAAVDAFLEAKATTAAVDAFLEAKTSATVALPSPPADGVDAVVLSDAHLSRPLYANPVCFLSTWAVGRRNLMTISWVSPLDNDGHFTLSMNARRHSARLLAANPVFCLSVACAGLENLLLRVGGCTGARLPDKASTLGVPLCQPGWAPLVSGEATLPGADDRPPGASDHQPHAVDDEASVVADPEDESGGDSIPAEDTGDAWGGLGPLSASRCFTVPHEAASEVQRFNGAFAVAPGIAHVVARVETVRLLHGHLQLTCQTVRAYVRQEYWSGKTLEPQRDGLPSPLNFLGSQRFVVQQQQQQGEARQRGEGMVASLRGNATRGSKKQSSY